jgi:hypothetical protein
MTLLSPLLARPAEDRRVSLSLQLLDLSDVE